MSYITMEPKIIFSKDGINLNGDIPLENGILGPANNTSQYATFSGDFDKLKNANWSMQFVFKFLNVDDLDDWKNNSIFVDSSGYDQWPSFGIYIDKNMLWLYGYNSPENDVIGLKVQIDSLNFEENANKWMTLNIENKNNTCTGTLADCNGVKFTNTTTINPNYIKTGINWNLLRAYSNGWHASSNVVIDLNNSWFKDENGKIIIDWLKTEKEF